jgi:predicted TPR repeat methyltransferase
VHEQLGNRDEAIKALRRARELDPSDPFGASVELMRLGADEASERHPPREYAVQYAPTFDTALRVSYIAALGVV